MKRKILSVLFLFMAVWAYAESKIYFDDLKIKPGETKSVELKLQNDDAVKGLQLVISLPEGMSFVEDEEEEEYAVGTDRCGWLSSQLKDNGSLGIAGFAQKKKDYIAVGDGAIATLLIKADEGLGYGEKEISVSDVEIVGTNSTINPATATFAITVYQVFKVTVTAADEKMGTATASAEEVEVNGEVTVTATPNEGYHFTNWIVGEEVVSTNAAYTFIVSENVNLVANFAPNQYTITYDLGGGELAEGYENPLTYTVESDDITLANPTLDGFTFAGWIGTDLSEPTIDVIIAKGSTGNRSYTATWNAATAIAAMPVDNKSVNVYDLQGRLIRSKLPVAMLNKELPRGIYIINGKKVAIAF